VKNASSAPGGNPVAIARSAIAAAAQNHAPGLPGLMNGSTAMSPVSSMSPMSSMSSMSSMSAPSFGAGHPRSGRWYRKGSDIYVKLR
jgi:hypothetical protein